MIKKSKFRVEVDGVTAYVAYTLADGALDIRHTIVPEEIGRAWHCVCLG